MSDRGHHQTSEGPPSARGGLERYRDRLDRIDDQIAHLLGERFDICRAVAHYKSAHGIPMMQPDRVDAVRARYLARGAAVDLPPDFSASLFELLSAATCRVEDEIIDELTQAREEQAS
jgi:4-amino-4-deoxychorismate mutase